MLQTLTTTESALTKLAVLFDTSEDVESVLYACFDWYYAPRTTERENYRDRVIAGEIERLTHDTEADLPDWFWRVHEILVQGDEVGNIHKSVPLPPGR